MYQSLQGCRAVAAALVVLFHLGGTFAQDRYFGFKALDGPFAWGDAGVDFFFVLSGFLITLAHRRDFGRPAELSRYLSKRALRIYPTYWVICLAVCLAAVVAPALRQALPTDPLTYLGALALIPLDPALVGGTGSPILFVAWSLQYEMLFYAVVAVLIANRTAGIALAAALFATVAFSALTAPHAFPLSFFGSNMILLFGLGVATAYVAKSGFRIPSPAFVAAAAAVLFVAFGLSGLGREGEHFFDRRIVNGVLSSLVVLGMVQAEDAGTLVLRHRWMGLLGDASYSLYLMHIAIISLLVKLVLRSGLTNRPALVVAFVAIFVVCVACSVLFYRFVEKPMLKWLRGKVGRVLQRQGLANDVVPTPGAGSRPVEGVAMKGLRGMSPRALLEHRMARRILASTGSNAYAQATTIAIQLLSLPLFLSRWDLTTYGQWLILSAVPSYLAMADVGMVTAAGNRMTMLIGEGNPRLANQVFQSALAFVLTVCGSAMLLIVAGVALWPSETLASVQTKCAIALLSATVVASLVGGFPEAIYKATHRYALGAALANTTRLLEWGGSLAGLWLSGSFVGVALGALVPRVLFTIAMMVHVKRSTPEFVWGFRDASAAEVKRCAGPAISFMAFPVANALNFQGMTLIAAAVLGPAATVVFNTYRTMARVTVQATSTFSLALWPEFSRLFGQRNLATLGKLYRRSVWLSAGLSVAASAVVYLAAPTVLHYWSKGQIDFSSPLMLAAMTYAATAGGWHVSRVLLLSTNEHKALAWPFLGASAACLPLAWLLADRFGLIGVMAAMLALEVGMLAWCSLLAQRLLRVDRPAAEIGAVA